MLKKKTLTVVATTLLCCNLMSTAWASSYKIETGDTLSSIASKYKITVDALKKANNMTGDGINTGAYLYIPDGGASHTVAAGETLGKIANRYQVTVASIKSANQLSNDTINVGQKLWIPLSNAGKNLSSRSGGNYSATREEIDLLAKAVYGEARGESFSGQVAVAAVVLNRLNSPDFPNTIAGVVYEPWAFTAVNDGQINLKPDNTAYQAAREALKGTDPTRGSTYYWNPKTATSQWIWSRAVVTKIDNHLFGY